MRSEFADVDNADFFLPLLTVTRILAALTSTIACVLALTSWTMIPKWRTFNNFVYFNLIVCYTVAYGMPFVIPLGYTNDFFTLLSCFTLCSFLGWFLVASINTYIDLVQVFTVHVSRKKTKCSLFVWITSLLNTSIVYAASTSNSQNVRLIMYICTIDVHVTLVCNCIIYFIVLNSLVKHWCRSKVECNRKFQAATFTFLMSGFMMLPIFVAQMLSLLHLDKQLYLYYAACSVVTGNIHTCIINVCFMILKSNRTMWRDFCCKRTENVLV